MNKMIVVVFDDEKSTYEGVTSLKQLHSEGSISLYGSGVIYKDENGEVQIKDAADSGLVGTAVGMATGGLMGLIAGPAGMVLGASMGGLTGVLFDLNKVGVDGQFLVDVSEALTPDTYAIVAEIDEMWMAPLDTRMTELNGLVFRRLRAEVEDDQLEREAEAFDKELQALEQEWEQSNDEAREKIQKQIDATKKKIEAINNQAQEKLKKTEEEGKAKIESLKQQISSANQERKEKMEARKAELEAEYKARSEKLNRAWELTKGALSS